ncbi:stage II sporulation protein P [Lysinibacillus sp. 38-6]|uniref:stage II sporulation protein P n=1 Tax=Lysinibacillus sp. 38-6 TaxID=3385991 RepID=UPI0039089869
MQTDKDLLNLMKEAYPLNPREEFVSSTSVKLKQLARKRDRKRKFIQLTMVSTSVAICALATLLFIFQTKQDSLHFNTTQEKNIAASTTTENPLVYIYQTHNLESFYSQSITTDSKEAYQDTQNITLVGERLSQALINNGIPSMHDKTNIMGILKEKNLYFHKAYDISREPLEKALANNSTIQMVFDIHRDSAERDMTTINLAGTDYSKVAFTVSTSSKNYEENYKFATLLHNKVEEKYPNLSRGVIVKNKPIGQITYNQDLFANAVLLEIGGIENTLEEEYRTADILANIIKELVVQ